MQRIFEEVAGFYDEIDSIEKDKIVIETVSKKKTSLFTPCASLFFLLVSIFIENVWIRIP